MAKSQHLLATGLGLHKRPSPSPYRLKSRTESARLSPAALYKLLDESEKPGRVLAFVTEEAERQSFPLLREELGELVQVEAVRIPSGLQSEDIDQFLRTLVAAVTRDGEARLTLDLTQGPRHFALLLYAGALYLQSLRKVSILGAYYCFFEGPAGDEVERPFFDLKPLLAFPRWIHAMETLIQARDAIPMAELLDEGDGRHIAKQIRMVTEAFASGLPLELGRAASVTIEEKLKPLRVLLDRAHRLPMSAEIAQRLRDWLEQFTFSARPGGAFLKTQVWLDEAELERQARLIDALFDLGNYRSALGLLDEWIVSWAIRQSGLASDWLNYECARRPAAGKLDALMRTFQDPDLRSGLSEEQRRLAKFWADVKGLRNGLAHHGMGKQSCLSDDKEFGASLDRVRDYWRNTMKSQPSIPLESGLREPVRLLISPIGERPGVLFSAVQVVGLDSRDAVLVICSDRTEGAIGEALQRAGYSGLPLTLKLQDPFAGVEEFESLLRQVRPHLARAAQVLVNVTGGTTLMGLLAEKLAQVAVQLGARVRRFGLVDRRTPAEQASEPYVPAEPFWLDG